MISKLNKIIFNNKLIPQYLCNKLKVENIHSTANKSHAMATNIVWMDLEMTGLDVMTDNILEVSCLITDKDLNVVAEGPCFAINQPKEVLDNMNEWCIKHHNESGLVEKCLKSQITTEKGELLILDFLKSHIPKGKCPLAGNSVYMDRLFLRKEMPKVDDYMHYRIIDVSTVKELARRWHPQILENAPAKKIAHRSLDDIKDSIEELKYYRQVFFK
ncbi:probable oligoribonuclease [Musca autumnalis]|uniref:probable oligoribonuclease n=1 Tax=Musca autumnalis TaxID=221902 RepID=UPI003CECC136